MSMTEVQSPTEGITIDRKPFESEVIDIMGGSARWEIQVHDHGLVALCDVMPRLAHSSDSARTFSTPAKVADVPKLMLGRHRGPRVAIAGSTIVVSAIGSEAGDLIAWRSAVVLVASLFDIVNRKTGE